MARFELDRLTEYTDEAILAEIRRVADIVNGTSLTLREFNKYAKVHGSTVQARFHGWQEALVAAGLGHRFWMKCTNDAMLDEIRRVASLVSGTTLSRGQFDKHASISSSAIQTRFQGWGNALAAAGLGHLYWGPVTTFRRRDPAVVNMSNDDIVTELRRVAQKVGTDTLTRQHLRAHSAISHKDLQRRFGSWANALQAAGFRLSKFGRYYSEEQYFENLLAVWIHYGRQPRNSEMNKPPSVISGPAYVKRFGRWTKALDAFVQRMNEPEKDPTRGTIRPALRLKILIRDNFRCVLCGRVPAPDRRCELHVDHIIPSSKGGQTSPENLRTTCSVCNIGKGDKLE